MGAPASPSGSRPSDRTPTGSAAPRFDPSRGEGLHPQYGGCDGFGPLGMCSECTGVIHCDDGSFTDNWRAGDNKLSQGEAATRVRAFLLSETECAALAAAMHTSEPKRLARFVRDVMADHFPRNFDEPRDLIGEQPF
jgi:hypothetical protein